MDEQSRRKFSWARLLFISGLGLAILFAATFLIVPRFIPWEKLKIQAEEKISTLLHHKVTIGDIRFKLFKGIEVKDLRVENAKGFSQPPLLTDEAVVVQYRLLPLLVGRIVIKAVILQKPRVLIERKADGTFNFSDMLPVKQRRARDIKTEDQGKRVSELPLELSVSQFTITDASLIYRDLKKKLEYRLDVFNLTVENLTLAGITPVNLNLETRVKALGRTYPVHLAVQWRFNYLQEEFKLDTAQITLPGIQVEAAGRIEKIISTPRLALSGKVSLDLQSMLDKLPPPTVQKRIPKELGLKGSAAITFNVNGPAKQIEKLKVTTDNNIDVIINMKGLDIPVTVDGKTVFESANVKINQSVTLAGIKAKVEAVLEDVFQTRNLSATVSGRLDLAEALPKLTPLKQRGKIFPLQTKGVISFQAEAKGRVTSPNALSFSSQIKARDIQLSYQEKTLLEQLSANVSILPNKIILEKLEADLAGQPVDASFVAEGFDLRDPATLKSDQMNARIQWNLNSELLDLDALLALLPRRSVPEAETKSAPVTISDLPEPDVRKFIPLGLFLQGKATLGGIKFGKVKLGRLNFFLELRKRILSASGNIRAYQGKIQNTARLDFSNHLLGYKIGAEVSGVDLEPLLNDIVDTFVAAKLKKPKLIVELKDKFTGRLSGTLRLSGKGMRTKNAAPNLSGKGVFTLKAGRIRQFSFQENLAKWFGSDKFRQDIPFDHTVLEFTMGNQMVHLKKFIMESGLRGESGDIRMTAKGRLTFAAAFKNFKLRPRLNPRAANNLAPEFDQYAEILRDERGWITIPVIFNGPVKKPSIKPDWDWIKKQMGSYIKQKTKAVNKAAEKKVKKFLEEQKGKSTKEIQENVSRELEKAKEKIKHLDFKNLFK